MNNRQMAAQLRDDFNALAVELDRHGQNVNIARVIAGTMGSSAEVCVFLAFVLMKFTSAIAVPLLAIIGGALGVVGFLTAVGARIAKWIIEEQILRAVSTRWTSFCRTTGRQVQGNPQEHNQIQRDMLENLVLLGFITDRISTVRRACTSNAQLVAAATSGGAIVLNAVFIGMSLYEIIDGSLEFHRGTNSKAGDTLREMAESLDVYANTGSWP